MGARPRRQQQRRRAEEGESMCAYRQALVCRRTRACGRFEFNQACAGQRVHNTTMLWEGYITQNIHNRAYKKEGCVNRDQQRHAKRGLLRFPRDVWGRPASLFPPHDLAVVQVFAIKCSSRISKGNCGPEASRGLLSGEGRCGHRRCSGGARPRAANSVSNK